MTGSRPHHDAPAPRPRAATAASLAVLLVLVVSGLVTTAASASLSRVQAAGRVAPAGATHAVIHGRRRPTAPPLICLRRARLLTPAADGRGVWVAFQSGPHNAVYVEGPFKSHRLARSLARSLVGKLALAGGPYVVISALGIHLDTKVASVAHCLRRARPGKGGYYTF